MIPNYLKPSSSTRLKPCQERMVGTCDVTSADGCCGVIPCKLCLEWEAYDGSISYGSADFATSSWTGTVGGGSFVAYWERSAYDECEFVVTFDGDEVYRATCYEGASCRNPSGEVSAAIGYDEGTLRWSVYEPRELALAVDPDTGCRDFFCGSCRCSCDCLCVTITDATGDITTGEICDVSYPCDAPVWEGTVGYYELLIALGRDEYGDCIITLTIDGDEQDPVTVTGCADMSATVTMYDGTTVEVRCKQCSCDETDITIPCCDEIPITAESLNARIEGDSGFGPEGQFADCTWEGVLPLYTVGGPYFRTWAGIIPLTVNGGCTDCCDDVVFFVHISCDGTSERKLCFHYWYANTEAGYTLTPLDEGNTGWNPGTGNTEGDAPGYCAPLVEFEDLDGEPTTETVYASCSPLMFHHEDSGVAVLSASELALP